MLRKHPSGLTLIEVLVSVALLGIVSVIIGSIFVRYQQVTAREIEDAALRTAHDRTLQNLRARIREARALAPTATLNNTAYTTDGDTLVLRIPAIDAQGNHLAGVNDTVVYDLQNEELREMVEPDANSKRPKTDRVLAAPITALAFTPNNANLSLADAVTVSLTLQKTVRGEVREITGAATVALRNIQ